MEFDFNLKKYDELCSSISKSNYVVMTMEEYLGYSSEELTLVLRHDVDSRITSALNLARIENKYSLPATYYFRNDAINHPDILKEIKSLGHEVGYHYEVMDMARGDSEEAIKIFQDELEKFRNHVDIRTICMHGNPLSPYDNLDLWKDYNYVDFNLVGEGYLSVNFNKILYFCDTSRTWNGTKYKVKDLVESTNLLDTNVKSTNDLIALIGQESENIYVSTHPARWKENNFKSSVDILLQSIKNIGKIALHYSFRNRRRG